MAILSNHFHLIYWSRPDEFELNSIRNDPEKVTTIRNGLSDVAWCMRLLCQNIGTRANKVDREWTTVQFGSRCSNECVQNAESDIETPIQSEAP